MKSALTSTIAILSLTQTNAFAPSPLKATTTTIIATKHNHKSTQLYGLFDGIKDAFVAPALERSTLDAERETPIDRWMGWNVKSTDSPSIAQGKWFFMLLAWIMDNCFQSKLTIFF
jgi:hypothetical protein